MKTFSGLAKVAIFTTNVDAENQTLINHKCVYGALTATFAKPVLATASFIHPAIHNPLFDIWIGLM
ncbi:MAG: hypothetical protein ACK5AQ_00060 [Bacteroidota bacterium]